MNGKLTIVVLDVLAVISLLIGIMSLFSLVYGGHTDTAFRWLLFACGLILYALLTGLELVIENLVQIRKNTEKLISVSKS